ncbi:ABC transporter permease [Salirhabdus salicampi]|uniref:ABC transporter permease n=1 Tax=Salirhabdus salicampi TaxID=476102 RepID=UPI0020C1DE97|nr:ABC transporter permease [Salirhabdus salicampi]MCP8615320.1 ABC transporter permease [Salirhabdus salicampi]
MIKTLLFHNVKQIIRQPALFISVLLFPFLLLGFLFFALYQLTEENTEHIVTAYVDEDDTFYTNAILAQLQDEEGFREAVQLVSMTEEEALTKLDENEIVAMIHIPDGFSRDLRRGINTPITLISNEQKPLPASMMKMLLTSGANYISAAQSAVNTVFDQYIVTIPSSNERRELLQQVIVQYTLFALNRNDLFVVEETEIGTTLGWYNHGTIAYLLTGIIVAGILFHFFIQQNFGRAMLERLRSIHITGRSIFYSQLLTYFFVMFVVFNIVSLVIGKHQTIDWLYHNQWWVICGLVSLLAAVHFSLLDWLIQNVAQRTALLSVVLFLALFLNGFWVPALYLPEWLRVVMKFSPWHQLYIGVESLIHNGSLASFTIMIVIVHSIILILFVHVLLSVKEGKDGYISFSSH